MGVMTAREMFLAELAEQRRARLERKCPRCRRPRAWLCAEEGRPCSPVPRKPSRSHAMREVNRQYWQRKAAAMGLV